MGPVRIGIGQVGTSIRAVASPESLGQHSVETMRIGMPLAAAMLAQMAMGVTDTILLGGLGPEALAAGGLGASLELTVMVVLQGVLAVVSVLVAQARGAGRDDQVPELYWTGMLLAVLLMIPSMALFGFAEDLLLLAGEPPDLARAVGAFVGLLRWCVPGALLGMGLMRAFLPAIGCGWLIFPVTVTGTVINGFSSYGLIHGLWGLPAMGMLGAAMATVLVTSLIAIALLLCAHASGTRRRFVRAAKPRLRVLAEMVRIGLPIGATFAVEAGLFFSVALLVGLLGPSTLAAHQVALTTISVAFMIPLGLAQAANVRVGHRVGALDREGARQAGLAAIALGAGFEFVFAAIELLAPDQVVGLFLERSNVEAFATAKTLLSVAVLFQVADGVQCVAAGALRGLGDTRVPFVLAALGYWGIGFPAAWGLTFWAGWGAVGAWSGLAAALMIVAALLTLRFSRRTAPARFSADPRMSEAT